MSGNITIEELAKELGNVSASTLLEQLKLSGVMVTKLTDLITQEQKKELIVSLKKAASNAQPKISLKRRSTVSQIKVKSASGKSSTVNVVTKKRRVYIKDESSTSEDEANNLNLSNKQSKLDDQIVEENLTALNEDAIAVETSTHSAGIAVATATPTNETTNEAVKDQKTLKSNKPKKDKKDKGILNPEEEKTTKKVKNKGVPDKDAFASKINLNLLAVVDEEIEDDNTDDSVTTGKVIHTRRSKKIYKSEKLQNQTNPHAFEKPTVPLKYKIEIPANITVAELAQKMSVKSTEVIKLLMKMGIMSTINQPIEQEVATLVVEEMGHTPILANHLNIENSIEIEYKCELQSRSPIVTVMGHVDHGKTSLLDYIRSTRVTAGEAGGITQHIGAYQVITNRGAITFLDTPGHSAFTAMRARGANCTDIVVLVVAADDSVMPQTIEAIQHAKAAKVPIIVAINKMDKPDASPEKVINDLSQHNVMPEDWGGDSMFVKISAKTGAGIEDLLEAIMLQAEMLELKAPYVGPAQGIVLESSLDRGRGIVATLLIQTGTLNKGDVILAGLEYGKVRALRNDQGKFIDNAGPSIPVEILGLNGAPLAGDKFQVVADERIAREVAALRQENKKTERLLQQHATKVSGFMDKMQQGNSVNVINIVLKADVQGSVEAISDALEKLSTDIIKINIIGKSVGAFNDSDVNLALASKAFLLGFNVRAESQAKILAKNQGTDFNYYSIIYDLIDAVKELIEGSTVAPVKEKIIGLAEVREVFRSSKFGTVAGCMVKEGLIKRGNPIRVLRDNIVIYEGELESLRRFKDNVNEVRNGMECGIGVKNYNDVKLNDQIEVFEIISPNKVAKSALELKR